MEFFQQLAAEKGEEAAWDALGGRDPQKIALDRMPLFLFSPDSAGMTGADLIIDAGYCL